MKKWPITKPALGDTEENSYDVCSICCRDCTDEAGVVRDGLFRCLNCEFPVLAEVGFTKHDKEKSRPDLIPAEFLEELGDVLAHGAKLYGDNNWRNCREPGRYLAAGFRHLLALLRGEELDPESGRSHAAHLGACAAFYFWLTRCKK